MMRMACQCDTTNVFDLPLFRHFLPVLTRTVTRDLTMMNSKQFRWAFLVL